MKEWWSVLAYMSIHVAVGVLAGWLIVLGYLAYVDHYAVQDSHTYQSQPYRDMPAIKFARMPDGASNGTYFYCLDCSNTSPCEGDGSGAIAIKLSGIWDCQIPAGEPMLLQEEPAYRNNSR